MRYAVILALLAVACAQDTEEKDYGVIAEFTLVPSVDAESKEGKALTEALMFAVSGFLNADSELWEFVSIEDVSEWTPTDESNLAAAGGRQRMLAQKPTQLKIGFDRKHDAEKAKTKLMTLRTSTAAANTFVTRWKQIASSHYSALGLTSAPSATLTIDLSKFKASTRSVHMWPDQEKKKERRRKKKKNMLRDGAVGSFAAGGATGAATAVIASTRTKIDKLEHLCLLVFGYTNGYGDAPGKDVDVSAKRAEAIKKQLCKKITTDYAHSSTGPVNPEVRIRTVGHGGVLQRKFMEKYIKANMKGKVEVVNQTAFKLYGDDRELHYNSELPDEYRGTSHQENVKNILADVNTSYRLKMEKLFEDKKAAEKMEKLFADQTTAQQEGNEFSVKKIGEGVHINFSEGVPELSHEIITFEMNGSKPDEEGMQVINAIALLIEKLDKYVDAYNKVLHRNPYAVEVTTTEIPAKSKKDSALVAQRVQLSMSGDPHFNRSDFSRSKNAYISPNTLDSAAYDEYEENVMTGCSSGTFTNGLAPVKQNALEASLAGSLDVRQNDPDPVTGKGYALDQAQETFMEPNTLHAEEDEDEDEDLLTGFFPGMFIEGFMCCIPPLGMSLKGCYKSYLDMAGWKRAVVQFIGSTSLGLFLTAIFIELIFDEWSAFADAPDEAILLVAVGGPITVWAFDLFVGYVESSIRKQQEKSNARMEAAN